MTTSKKPSFQEIILRLQQYWSDKGCALLQPYDMEVGAGTSHTATFLRWRDDKPPAECTYDQIDVTPAYELAKIFGS